MITAFLIRRQREKGKKTIFIKGPGDKNSKKKRNTYDASSDEIDKMFEVVRKALVGESIQGIFWQRL